MGKPKSKRAAVRTVTRASRRLMWFPHGCVIALIWALCERAALQGGVTFERSTSVSRQSGEYIGWVRCPSAASGG